MHGGELQTAYEAILAQEGLSPDAAEAGQWSDYRAGMAASTFEDAAASVDAWKAWAAEVERTYPFRKRRQRAVWKLYAQGVLVRDIPARLGSAWTNANAVREVKTTIARIKAKSPPGPPNPWYRGQPSDNSPTERTSMPIRTLHYSQVALHRPIKVPGSMNTDVFNNIDGTPHAGGIDIEVGDQIVLVTWNNVKSATRKALVAE